MVETFYFRLKRRGWTTRFLTVRAPCLMDAYDVMKRQEPSYQLEVMDERSWQRAKEAQEYWNERREA